MAAKYIPLTNDLYDYMIARRSNANDPVLAALDAETQNLGEVSRMAIGPDQSSLMTLLVAAIGAKWAVEVGTFTGTSSISIARGLAPGGKLVCFDQDFKWTSIARRYWIKAGVQDKIELKLGNARDQVAHFRPKAPLDFVFIDADKESYDIYYELLLPHVRPGGLIVFDNMLMGGRVIDPLEKNKPANRTVDQLNRKLAEDPQGPIRPDPRRRRTEHLPQAMKSLLVVLFFALGCVGACAQDAHITASSFGFHWGDQPDQPELDPQSRNMEVMNDVWGDYIDCLKQLNKPFPKASRDGYSQAQINLWTTGSRYAYLLQAMTEFRAFTTQNPGYANKAQKAEVARIDKVLRSLNLHYQPRGIQGISDFCEKMGPNRIRPALSPVLRDDDGTPRPIPSFQFGSSR